MRTILVVDDEFAITAILETILGDAGYRVVTAPDGKRGLARLGEHAPDLILLNQMMPVLDGPGMMRAPGGASDGGIPVVIMTALPETAIAADCRDSSAGYLRKPFTDRAVLDVVTRVLGPANSASAATVHLDPSPSAGDHPGERLPADPGQLRGCAAAPSPGAASAMSRSGE